MTVVLVDGPYDGLLVHIPGATPPTSVYVPAGLDAGNGKCLDLVKPDIALYSTATMRAVRYTRAYDFDPRANDNDYRPRYRFAP